MASVALKVDCDTYLGTRDGIPRLLDILGRRGIRATFFFTLGPDRSGVAIRRVFTRKGFLKKMIRSRAPSLYPMRTMLSGTLLPAPRIGERCGAQIRAVGQAGHETGVHGWDHVRWHDGLERMSLEVVRAQYGHAHAEYLRLFGHPARMSAAPGWTVSALSLEVQEERALLFTSDTRGGAPFFPAAGGRVFRTLEIPTTLPTLDEVLAWPHLGSDDARRRFYRNAVPNAPSTAVHTIHTEVEGGPHAALFEKTLDDWRADGVVFVTLSEIARETLGGHEPIPERAIVKARLAGRGGRVATGWPEER
ncbi:MAG TPA: polysaccharide deacetylase family protein [Thermoanaerobaculia bacterium]